MPNPNDKVKNLYDTFVKDGYAMEPEAQFRENLKDPKKRKAAYDALVKDGYDMEPYAEFESNIGFAKAALAPKKETPSSGQQKPAVTPAASSAPAKQQPKKDQPLTPAQRQAMIDQVQQMQQQTQAMIADTNERMKNMKEYGVGLGFGQTKKSGYKVNPRTGKLEQTYITPTGNRYNNKALADAESFHYRQEASKPLGLNMNDQQVDAAQKPANAAVAALWKEAEAKYAADRNKNAEEVYGGNPWLHAGREMHIVDAATNSHKNEVSHLTRFDLQKMMDNAWGRVGKQMTASCYAQLKKQYPTATEQQLQNSASAMARQLSDNAVYKYAVAKNTPKSTLEFFAKTAADMNLLRTISKGLARSEAGTTGDLAAYEAAMGEYGKNHRLAQIGGTVTGMLFDPTTYISGGVGSFTGKTALNIGGRIVAKKTATNVGARLFGNTLTGRVVAGMAGGAGNLGTYEGIKEGESQWLHGGHINPQTGENEGYSAGDVLKSSLHGTLLGSVTGTASPLLGNVADKWVKATSNTAGKVGIRAGELATSTVAEGTIFSIPEWISGDGDAMDVWTDNMAMMIGFKGQHMIKSAPRVIAGLRPIENPQTMQERNHNRMSFVERLRKQVDASPRDMAFTKEEREELQKYGYGDLATLFTRTPKQQPKPKSKPTTKDGKVMYLDIPEAKVEDLGKQWLKQHPEFDGYEAMERLMQDPNVSQSARAKAYYILTGRQLPMGSVTGYTTEQDENGNIFVKSVTANGEVVTSRRFADETLAKKEQDIIMRQAELNSVDVGERYTEAKADNKVWEAAVEAIAPGADLETVKRNYQAAKEGDKDAIANYGQMVDAIDKFMEENKGMADAERPEAIRAAIKEETGVDVDDAIKKEPSKRTEPEKVAVQDYIERLFPEQKAENEQPMSDDMAGASAIYDQSRLLWDKVEQGDADAKAEIDAIALRMQEAYKECEDAFGTDAEMRMAEMEDNPWSLANDPELTDDQRDAVLYYINAKAAMDGVQDASNDALENKRMEVAANVEKHTHKDNGMVQTATMKVDDKPVYIVKGNVVMFPDGSGVDVQNSDKSIVICDAETGEYQFTSPDQIFNVGEPIDPQSELDEAYANIQAEHEAMLGATENGESVPNSEESVPETPENVKNESENVQQPMTDEQLHQYAQGAFDEVTQGNNGVSLPQEQIEQLQQHNQQMLEQEQHRKEDEAKRQPTALERVPINEETQERMFEKADKETALDALNEITGGNEANTTAIVNAQVEQAQKTLDALKKKQPTKKAPALKGSPMAMVKAQQEADANYNAAMEQYNVQVAEAEETLSAWSRIYVLMNERKRALREKQEAEQRERDKQLHDEAVAQLAEQKRIAAEKAAEQEAIGTHAVNPKIKAKWDGATKVEGNPNAITLADGSTLRGHYVLTEAGAASASHDINNAYEPTEGFPIDENGESVNDRDYKRDTDAQQIVRDIARSYDSRALQSPVIVSKDGIVLSGNNRTMSGDMAAQQGTDKAYIDHLREFGQMYGFTPEQIGAMKHPRVVFVPDEELPYDASTFARFNAESQKKQSKPEQAVKLGKVVPDNVFNSIVGDISRYDRLSDYYTDEKAISSAISQLQRAGVINEMQLPEMRTGNALSAAGKELIENTLIGKVFQTSPDAVRQIIATPTLRQSIIMGLNEIAHNRTLAKNGYDLSQELGAAVDLVARAKAHDADLYKEGVPVSPFGRQQGLFDDEYGDSRVTDGTTLLLADILNSGKPSDLRKVLSAYNAQSTAPAGGQLDMFTGDVTSKETILNTINEHFRNATPKEQQALIDAAIAERKRNAEAEAEQRGRGKTTEQVEDAVQRSAEPQQSTVTENEPVKEETLSAQIEAASAEVNTEPTEAQKEAGNYKKGHVQVGTFDITIEQPQGSVRKGTDADGKQWESKMNNAYGYIRGAVGVDGDHIDVFLSNDIDGWNGRKVFVVDQYNPDGSFDEHKVMLGFNDADEAKSDYLANYENGWENGRRIDVTAVNLEDFEKWIESSKRKTKPFAEYAGVKKETVGNKPSEASLSLSMPVADEGEGKGYSITPSTYTNKKGKTSDVSLLTFDNDLTADQERAVKEFAKERTGEGRFAPARGWKDRESGGWMFRSEEDARKAAEMVGNEEAVADNQPMTAQELRDAVEPKKPTASKKTAAKKPANRVEVADVAEQKPSEPTKAEQPKQDGEKKLVITDEMKHDEDILRELLGIGDEELDGGIKFRDPDAMTSQQRRFVYNAGVNYSLGYIDQGFVKFPEFAKAMVSRLGYKIKPWLKSFYEGAKRIPGYDQTMFTPTEEVDAFDVENFDKPYKDVMAQANMIVEEGKAQVAADKANNELKATRNEQRKETEKQTAANTDAVAAEAKSVASEATALAETSSDEQALTGAAERVDETLDKVNEQLALLGYYEADEVEKDYNEAYGYMRNAEKKAVKDAANLASQLIDDLGLDRFEATHGEADKKGKRKTKPLAVANIAPAGGDVSMHLPLAEGRELYLTIGVEPRAAKGVEGFGGSDLEVTHIMFRVENPESTGNDRNGRNEWVNNDVTYSELLDKVQREAYKYIPERTEVADGEYKVGDKVQYSPDGGRTWKDAVVAQPNDEGGIRIDTGLAPVLWVNAHPEQLRHKPKANTNSGNIADNPQSWVGRTFVYDSGDTILKCTYIVGKYASFEDVKMHYNTTNEVSKFKEMLKSGMFKVQDEKPTEPQNEDIFQKAERIAKEAKTEREKTPIDNNGFGIYQKAYDDFIDGIEHKGMLPNVKTLKNMVTKAKRRLGVLEKGAAVGIKNDEDLKRHEKAVHGLINMRDAYQAMLDYVNKRMKASEVKTSKVKPEQPVGDLFAGLFDEPNNNETADSNSSSPSQTVAGAERPDTVGIDETGTDGAERTTAVAGTDGERSTDASRENGREAADGAVHGTDEVGGIQPPVGNRGRDESAADGTVSNGATNERGRVAGPRTVQTGEIDGGGKELSSGEPASSTGEGSRPSAVKKQRTLVRKFTNNFHYGTDGNEADNYTPAQRLEGNVSAIEVIAKLFKEGRKATDEEKQILSRFRGWGQIDQLSKFYSVDQMRRDTYGNSPYRRLANAIETLDPDGKKGVFAGIKRAALSSYYTPTKIASAMNSFLSLAGFKGGTFLDPSMGNGIFEGTLPKDIQERTMITGVELDWLSGQISRALYPDADVRICGFEKSELTPNSQDVVTSNVPFGDIEVNDPTWKNDNSPVKRSAQKRIHNYYAVKMLELTRPGGIVAMMTSPAVMDTQSNQHIRRYIAEQGEFLGAVRLPDNTFQGTGAMADIIYIRKWKDEEDAQKTRENPDYVAREQAFLSSAETTAPNKRNGEKQKVSHNAYYASNRKNMIGDVVAGNQYNDKSFGLHSELTTDQISKEVEKAVKRIVGDRKGMLFDTTRTSREVKQAVREEYKGDGNWVSTGNLVIQDGKVGVLTATKNEYGEVTRVFEEQPQLAKQKKRIIGMGEVRTAMKELIAGQIDGFSDTKLNMLRAKLKRAYDEFVSKFGKLQDTDNAVVLSDIDGYTLQALEVWKGGKFQGLSDIFTKNTIKPALKLEDAKTPQEAITTSLAEYGEIRGEYIEKALGADWFEQCGDLVFKEPNATDRYVTRDEYLSGDVVAKLEEAKTAAATDPTFERNVKELEQVQPATIPFDDITIHLGARWIPQEVLNDFVKETLGLHASSSRNYEWVDGERREIIKSGVVYVPETDSFEINIEAKELGGQADDWKTADKSVKEIFQAALEDKDFRIVRKDKDGNTWIDQEATELANSKVADLREHFEQWLPSDDARIQMMERAYNDRFNRIVLRKWDGSHLNVPGLMGKELRPHQKDAVWMLINNRGGIVDHIVGAGKTLVMQSAIMEMRRMGIAKKPMIVALKSTVPQIAREFKEAYPTARVLAPSEKDFSTENRKKFFANISLNDYDCIIVSHDQYCKIPHSEEAESEVVNEQLAQLDAMIEYLYGTGDKSQLTKRQIKSLEKRRQNLHAKLEKRLDRSTDREFCFENMGIDYLFVDECHRFKSLPYVTSYQNVAGLGEASGSNKAVALLTGIRHLQKMHQGDKGTVFLSGTTITNSLVEIYNLLNYLRPRKLEQLGMPTFDAWASTFAVHSSELEAGVSNEFKMKDRFRYFDNVPELSQLYAEIADVRNDYNLQLPKPKVDGKTVIVPQSDAVAEINREVVNMLQTKDGSYFGIHPKDPKKFPWGLVASGISAKAAVSPRLVFPEMDDSVGKISYCCDNIKKSYDEMKEQKGVQLVFCELGVPSKDKKEYDAYHDIINRLTKDYGIPREEIAYIQQVKDDMEKEALFQKVRDGKVRILIGGTGNMGTGVNVQTRITDLHMLTVPWQPADLEQCIGRGSRQGNVVAHDFLNNKVRVHYYATEGSLDLYKYQLLDAKGKMFTQFKMGTISGERSFDEGDADENGNIDPAQMVALLSGNPIIFEKSKQDKLVKKLKSLYNGFLRDQQRKRQNYETVTKKVDNLKRLISLSDSDVHDLQREGFKPDEKGTYPSKVKVCVEGSYYGQDFDKPKEAGQYILEQLKNNKKVVLAGFGQRADVVFVTGDDLLSSHYEVQLGGNNAWSIRYTKRMPQDPTQAGLVFRSLLEQIIHNNEVYHREYDTNSEMLKTMPKGDVPFPKQKELDAEYNKLGQSEEDKTKFRLLDADDPKAMELESLSESELVPVYRNVQAFEDDALGSPMAFTDAETGERRTLEGRRWNYSAPPKVELTEEQQRKLDELNKNGYIMVDGKKSTELQINDGLKFVKPKTKEAQLQYFLKKNPEDKGLWAAYDPYDHAIETPLNTQFGEAYKRPNLVVVRSLIPKSEIDEPFHADYALLPTGAHQWNNGRTLYLSRWSKIDKVLTREEEAKLIDEYWKKHPGKREELKTHRDYNRFVPQVRRELEKMGYRFELDGKELTPEESLALDKQNWESRDIIPGREGHTPFVSNEDIARINAKMAGKWVGEPKEAMESAMSERVTELSERLHTPVRIIRTEEEVAALPSVRQRRMKGSFNPMTGEVTIVVPNNANMADVENTFVHEVVGHDGLRVLFPDEAKLNNALDELYRVSKDEIRGTIDRMAQKMYDADVDRIREKKHKEHIANGEDANASYYADMAEAHAEASKKREQFRRDATEEYGADLAGRIGEKGFEKMSAEELTFWGKLKAMLQKALQKLLDGLKIPGKRKWGDKDWAFVLHEAYKRKKNGGKPTVFDAADTEVMRRKTGFGDTKFSDGKREQQTANERFNNELTRYQNGEMDKNEMLHLGRPQGVMRTFLPNLPIVMRQRVIKKGSEKKHEVDVSAIMNMPQHLSSPIFVFQRSEDTIGVLTDMRDRNGKNVCVAIELKRQIQQGAEYLEVNDVRSFHGREFKNIVEPIANNKTLKWVDKEKGLAYLSSASQPVQQEIDKQVLDTATKIVKDFVNPKVSDENVADEGIMFRDGDMGLEETITKMKVEASQANADNWQAKQDAMRAIGGNLNKLRQAMARQREYDLTTVKSITDLAKVLLENGLLDDLSKYETKRILSAVNNAHGKQDISNQVAKVMDIMVDNQLRMGANMLGRLLSTRGSRVDARGIEVQGQLDPDGQTIAQVVRKATSLPKADIEERIAEALNRMGSDDQAVADEAALEYSGLLLAHQFAEDITESKSEERALRDSIKQAKEDMDAGKMDKDAYREYVDATNDAIRQNKIERAEAYRSIVEQVGGVLGGSIERAKAWREAEKQRVEAIHHNANSDMVGRPTDEHHKESKVQKIANNNLVRFALAPLGTFDQMLRMFGKKSVNGEGYLWNRYMRGWVDATEKEYTGYQNALKTLDEKVSEVFGKKMQWGDLFAMERKMPCATVTFWDGGEQKSHELTQGNLLYIYMVDKMADGRMKLRRMGITEEDVENIKDFVEPRFLQLADWMQEEFLVGKRNEYNEVHKRMFGASMAAIENYFPLKILANARLEDVDVAYDTTDTALPSTSTGSIIKRRRNNLALDVMGADAFSVILDHVQQMERWAAFAEFNRDLNTLLSYKHFRNQVMNMSSVYGGGNTLWKNFRNVCGMAAGAYRPPIAQLDKAAVNIAKGVTAAKVSFRVFTALKQFLSMPAYLSDSNPIYLAANIANPIGAWKWSMQNLPLFEKRWKSRMAGDPRLMKSEMDWKMWQNHVVEIASRIGMSPNAFVDALTVAIGAHSMYQTKKKKYLRYGYDEDTAEKRAKQDATILFNQTQQSSESAFLSTMQTDRSWLSVLFTIFRNSSMSYTRQLYDAIRNIKHRFEPGYKELSEEFMAKQMRRDGIDPDKADNNAKSEYRRSLLHDIARIGVFGYILQFAWNLGAYLPYLIAGDDEDEKSNMWDDVINHTMFGSIEGLTGGDVMSSAGQMALNGEANWSYLVKDMPLASDLATILQKMPKDKVAAMNDVVNLLVQSGVGVNPQSLTDAVVAIMDYCGGDAQTSRECALLIARILNCPQSQTDKIYFDELGATAEEAGKMTPAEIAERYAEYKIHRGAPLTGWAYSEEARDSVKTSMQNRVLTQAKEKLNNRVQTEETKQLLSVYDEVAKQHTELSKLKKTDRAAYREGMKQLRKSNDMRQHMRLKRYKHDMRQLTEKYLRSKDAAERDRLVNVMFSTREKMLEDIGRMKQQ
jgi:N12 class adenine-specific DNA methylase